MRVVTFEHILRGNVDIKFYPKNDLELKLIIFSVFSDKITLVMSRKCLNEDQIIRSLNCLENDFEDDEEIVSENDSEDEDNLLPDKADSFSSSSEKKQITMMMMIKT